MPVEAGAVPDAEPVDEHAKKLKRRGDNSCDPGKEPRRYTSPSIHDHPIVLGPREAMDFFDGALSAAAHVRFILAV